MEPAGGGQDVGCAARPLWPAQRAGHQPNLADAALGGGLPGRPTCRPRLTRLQAGSCACLVLASSGPQHPRATHGTPPPPAGARGRRRLAHPVLPGAGAGPHARGTQRPCRRVAGHVSGEASRPVCVHQKMRRPSVLSWVGKEVSGECENAPPCRSQCPRAPVLLTMLLLSLHAAGPRPGMHHRWAAGRLLLHGAGGGCEPGRRWRIWSCSHAANLSQHSRQGPAAVIVVEE